MHWLDMTDRIQFRIAVTVQCIAVFMALLRNTCLKCSFLRQLGHLITVSDPQQQARRAAS